MEQQKQVYTMKEIMELLGLSKCTVYKLAKQGAFPVIKLGKQYFSPVQAFHKYMDTLEF